jgi:hypothetical protein
VRKYQADIVLQSSHLLEPNHDAQEKNAATAPLNVAAATRAALRLFMLKAISFNWQYALEITLHA